MIPAIEVAIGRFREMQSLNGEIDALGEQLEIRKTLDRAKGVLMDKYKLSEADSFGFLQRSAMNLRLTMHTVAGQVVAGELHP